MPRPLTDDLPARLRAAIEAHGHTQAEAARAICPDGATPISQSTLTRWLTGQRVPAPVFRAAVLRYIESAPRG
jgi:plasmid stability protein